MAQSQRKPQPKAPASNLKVFYWVLGVVALIGGGWLVMSTLRSSQAAQEPVDLPPEALNDPQQLVKTARGIKVGPDNAPIRILVFSDFQCPACMQFATNVEPGLRQDFVNTGKVQLVYYDYPLHPSPHRWAFVAARAGRCAEDQSKFWEYHDLMFAKQREWAYDQSAPVGRFEGYARDAGLDGSAFQTCLRSERHADVVTANKALGDQLGVRGTPTLFMSPSGQRLDEEWKDYAVMKARLEKELGTSGAPAPATSQ